MGYLKESFMLLKIDINGALCRLKIRRDPNLMKWSLLPSTLIEKAELNDLFTCERDGVIPGKASGTKVFIFP